MPFWSFLAVLSFFGVIFQNIDKNNSCASIVFKAKTKEKCKENLFKGFCFKTYKGAFWGSTNFFYIFFCFSFKNNRPKNVV